MTPRIFRTQLLHKKLTFVSSLILLLSSCAQNTPMKNIDIQGHRGCRGLMPENTIPAFIEAVSIGVHTLELDVCISKDSQVVVSHEPWLSAEICTLANQEITEENQMDFNLFSMNYSEIKKADCGSKKHPRFPSQKSIITHKPLLSEVIEEVNAYCRFNNIEMPAFNIELKMNPDGDDIYHPKPEVFANLVLDVLNEYGIEKSSTIQSFDFRVLKYLHIHRPDIQIAALVENVKGIDANLENLGFTPHIYSPYFKLIDAADVRKLNKMGILVIPWTVNSSDDIEYTLSLGVDGIISDFPDRVFEVLQEVPSKKYHFSK